MSYYDYVRMPVLLGRWPPKKYRGCAMVY